MKPSDSVTDLDSQQLAPEPGEALLIGRVDHYGPDLGNHIVGHVTLLVLRGSTALSASTRGRM